MELINKTLILSLSKISEDKFQKLILHTFHNEEKVFFQIDCATNTIQIRNHQFPEILGFTEFNRSEVMSEFINPFSYIFDIFINEDQSQYIALRHSKNYS